MQDACALALTKWPAEGVPASPRGWLVGVARHKALDLLRREARRAPLEAAAARGWPSPQDDASGQEDLGDEELALIFMCCHPALDPEARIALTLRCVCGLATAEIAAAFVVPEPTMAQRLVRAKRKIRQAGIRLKSPGREDLPRRLAAVLRAVYLIFTQGHMAPDGPDLVRGTLCEQAIRLARALAALMPDEPEVTGLLALLLLTDARGRPEPATRVSSSCSATRTAADGTRPRLPRAPPCWNGRSRSAAPARTSCTPRSPRATSSQTLTGGRSPRCTVS